VARRCPDIGRLRALTGFAPKISLEAGVAETFDWYRQWWERGEAGR
jgi:UDP-glucose 4-epimerase/UDP-glucuronate decarboxylase